MADWNGCLRGHLTLFLYSHWLQANTRYMFVHDVYNGSNGTNTIGISDGMIRAQKRIKRILRKIIHLTFHGNQLTTIPENRRNCRIIHVTH